MHKIIILTFGLLSIFTISTFLSAMEKENHFEEFDFELILKEIVESFYFDPAVPDTCFKQYLHTENVKHIISLGDDVIPFVIEHLKSGYNYYSSYSFYTCLFVIRSISNNITEKDKTLVIKSISHIPFLSSSELFGEQYNNFQLIRYEVIRTLADMNTETSKNLLYQITFDENIETEMRIYAGSYLLQDNSSVQKEVQNYILSVYKNEGFSRSSLRLIAYWRLSDSEIQGEILESWENSFLGKGNNRICEGTYHFLLDLMKNSDEKIVSYLIRGLDHDQYHIEIMDIPLAIIEHILQYYSETQFPRAWLKEKCLQHGGVFFHGITFGEHDLRSAKRWISIRHELFPELPNVSIRRVDFQELEAARLSGNTGVLNLEGVWLLGRGNLLEIDSKTGLVNNFPDKLRTEIN